MTLTRRSLLAMLALAAADPERLLWVPGKRLISIPRPPKAVYARIDTAGNQPGGDITAIVVLDRFGNALSTHRYPPRQRIRWLTGHRFIIGHVPPVPKLPPGLRLWPGQPAVGVRS